MKQAIHLILLLFLSLISCSSEAQGIQSIHWTENPLYPVPFPYTLNHMKLNGNVKEIKETHIGEKVFKYIYQFNVDGKLKRRTDSVSGKQSGYVEYKDTVFYNTPGQQDLIEVSFFEDKEKRSLLSFNNGKLLKRSIFSNYSSITGSALKQKDSMLFDPTRYSYDDKGLLSHITYSKNFVQHRTEKFTYNEAGQLIRREDKWDKYEKGFVGNVWMDIKKGEDIYLEEITYEHDGDLLKVTISKAYNKTGIVNIVEFYDTNSLISKRIDETGKKETTYQYTFDSNKNWILRTEASKDILSGKETKKYTHRIISYY